MKSFPFFAQKSIFLFTVFLISVVALHAQNDPSTDPPKVPKAKSEFWRDVQFGGGLGLGTGNGFFSATLAPSAVYRFTQNFSAGVGLTGTYSSRKDQFNSTILGGSLISLYSPIKEIQLSAEFEELNVSRTYKGSFSTLEDDNYWYPALFVGGGYRANFATIGIRYDLLYDENTSVYQNAWAPFVRVFF